MYDSGKISYFMEMEVEQYDSVIFISQKKYVLDILKKFKLESYKEVRTPRVLYEKVSRDDSCGLENPSIFRSVVGKLLF